MAHSDSALDTYAVFREAVDSESSFVHRDYRLVLAPGRTSQPAVDSVILLEAALERPRVAALGAKNNKIMFRISCALLVAVANGLYAPQQPRFASRARPLAAAEGSAAAEAKKRIARLQCLRHRSNTTQKCKEKPDAKARATTQHSSPSQRFPRANQENTQVVVGNGMVGQRLVELCADKLEERGASDQVDIVSFCEERLAAYNRVRLTSWFETRDADDLSLVGSYKDAPQGEWYASEERPNCKVRVGDLATGLDVDKKTVACGDELVSYDKCVLATGSYPFVPPIPGKDLPGVFVYRTIDDLEALVAYQKAHGSSPRPSSAAASSASKRPRPCTIWA